MRFAAGAALLALAGLLAAGIARLEYDRGQWLPANHPEQQKLDRLAEDFSAGEVLIIAFDLGDDFYRPATLDALRQLEEALRQDLGAGLLDSLSPLSAQHILDAGESLEIAEYDALLERGLIAGLQEYRKIFSQSPYAGKLVSPAGRAAALRLRLDSRNRPDIRKALLEKIKARLAVHPLGVSARLAGEPVIKERLRAQSQAGLPRLLLFAAMMLAGMALLTLRRLRPAAAALTAAALAAAGALALMGASGHDVNPISLMLPVMLAVIAFADALHIAAHVNRHAHRHGALAKGLRAAALPCFAASLTSAIGFGAFMFSQLIPLQQFGASAIAAILLAFPLTLLACFAILPDGQQVRDAAKRDQSARVADFAAGLAGLTMRHPRRIGGGLAGLLLLLACGLGVARTETNFLSVFFYPESDIRQDFAFVDERLGGSGGVDVILHAGEGTRFNQFSGFAAHQAERARLETIGAVQSVESYALALREARRAFTGQSGLPATEAELAQLLLFLELSRSETRDDVLSPYAAFFYDKARIYLRLPDLSSHALADHIAAIEQAPAAPFQRRELTGFGAFINVLSAEVLKTQLVSFGLTLALIGALFLAQFGLRLGMLGMAANLLPVGALGGIIALSGTPFDFGAVLIAGITLGMSVDDAVHFLYAYRRRAHLPARERLADTLLLTARPILLTSLVFCAGLAVLFISPLAMLDRFAFFTITGLALAVMACLILLPAWLARAKP